MTGSRLAVVLAALVTLTMVVSAPSLNVAITDHAAFALTHRAMRSGKGFYEAFADSFATLGIVLSEPRSFRQPAIHLIWAALPPRALGALFFVGPVFLSSLLGTAVSRWSWPGLAAGIWVGLGGHHLGYNAWLLSELWAAPLVLGAAAAWLARRDGLVAACAAGAFLVRETMAPLLISLAVAARLRRRPVRPYAVAAIVCLAGFSLHVWLARRFTVAGGNEAPTWGTGGVDRVIDMTSNGGLLVPDAVGVAVWVLGVLLAWRSDLRPFVPTLLIPVAGLAIGRDYWGLATMPLAAACSLGVIGRRHGPSRTPHARPGPEAKTATSDPPMSPA